MDTKNTIMEALGIDVVDVSQNKVICTMPVDHRTIQPFGLLHGGASLVLAETAASIGTLAHIDQTHEVASGMEINANHLRSVSHGTVTAIATPLHKGKTTMIWDIKVFDDQERLICVSRCTVAIVRKR